MSRCDTTLTSSVCDSLLCFVHLYASSDRVTSSLGVITTQYDGGGRLVLTNKEGENSFVPVSSLGHELSKCRFRRETACDRWLVRHCFKFPLNNLGVRSDANTLDSRKLLACLL